METLIQFASRFKGFLAFSALIFLGLMLLVNYLFTEGSFDRLLIGFGNLSSNQFLSIVYLALGLPFIIIILLIILSFVTTSRESGNKKPQSGLIYITVYDEEDPTKGIPDAEVRLMLPEPRITHTDKDGGARVAFPAEFANEVYLINASKIGYQAGTEQSIKMIHGTVVRIGLIDETGSSSRKKADNVQTTKYLTILRESSDLNELNVAVDYLRANPTHEALQPLASLALRDETEYMSLRSHAIEVIGEIKTDESLKLLLQRAVSERLPGVRAMYVRALQGFNDPSMIEPLISCLETAHGDNLGYPSLILARKLGNPKLSTAVKRHLDDVFNTNTRGKYLKLARDVLFELEIKALHESIGLQINLPYSLDLLMEKRSFSDIQNERDPRRKAVLLNYLQSHPILPKQDIVKLSIDSLSSNDILLRWTAAELATSVNMNSVDTALRIAFKSEQNPFLDGVLAQSLSRNWQQGDCDLLASKLRMYSFVDQYDLSTVRYTESANAIVAELVRNNCFKAVASIELLVNALETNSYFPEKETVKNLRRALLVLTNENEH